MIPLKMTSNKTLNCRGDDAEPVYQICQQSLTRDYQVIQIKDENRRIKMILRATDHNSFTTVVSLPATRKRPAVAFDHGSFPKKRRSTSYHAHYRRSVAKAAARSVGQPTVRKRLLPQNEGHEPKRPRVAESQDSDSDNRSPSIDNDWFIQVGLSAKDIEVLDNGEWLTDEHISAAQRLLRRQFPTFGGLQEPVLGEILQFEPMTTDGAQIMLNGGGHWVTVCRANSEIKLLDSKNEGLNSKLSSQIINLCGDKVGRSLGLQVQLPVMHPQRGSSDCGLFAVAYATEVAFGGRPELTVFDQKAMRKHLKCCLESQKMTPFPRKNCAQRTSRNVGCKAQTLRN
ncbi:uncharacterized protein LOC110977363 [Acanthaster planci]|uniref:Uncharacterized protein LOC110977363 n=1 Tax=Acanthaster planci TaxID=133434 RepID=A0A8B7Y444_ACAPL|nr:uncharacterized protein LOC110977363 [Acanthaster planci]